MSDDDPRLLNLARQVSEGAGIDWGAAEKTAAGPDEKEVVRGLRDVERIVAAHRRYHSIALESPTSELTHPELPAPRPEGARGDPSRPDEPPREVPRQWGPLEILERIGSGGYGEVYRARDRHLDREVALKLLRKNASEGEIASAVIEEGRLLARVRHASIATVHGAERHDGRVGIWMELLRGRTLTQVLREQGTLGAREAGLIGLDLCQALAAVHGEGLLHRDVKAQNVMRVEGGRIVLMDFGAGKDLLHHGDGAPSVSGTPVYMAPELFKGGPATAASDIYSLGVLLYHLVSGTFPVRGAGIQDLREQHGKGISQPLGELRSDLPPAFVRVVERALARRPADRYASAAAMEQALAAAIGVEGTATAPPAASPGARSPSAMASGTNASTSPARHRNRPLLAGIAAVLALTAGLIVVRNRLMDSGTSPDVTSQAAAEPGNLRPAAPAAPGGIDAAPAAGTAVPPYEVEATFFRGTSARQRLTSEDRVHVGDTLSLQFKASRDLFVYVINEDDKGEAVLMYPLRGAGPVKALAAGVEHRIPGALDGQQRYWQVTSAGGREHFLVIASPERLPELEAATAAMIRPEPNRPLQYARLSDDTKLHLRGVAGLVVGPAPTSDTRSRLFEWAEKLPATPERATGAWVRRLDLENPGP